MRGKQFSYYVTRQDWSWLLDRLAGSIQFDIYTSIFHGDIANAFTTLDEAKISDELSYNFTNVGNRRIVCHPFGRRVGAINKFIIDTETSEVIEVARCFVGVEKGEEIIRLGRMYYVSKSLGALATQVKSENFLSFAAALFRRSKRLLIRDHEDSYYYGPEALLLKRAGKVKFV